MNNEIKKLIQSSQNQLNTSIFLRSVLIGVIISCCVSLVYGMFYIMQGYAVHSNVYIVNVVLFFILVGLHFYFHFVNQTKTAQIIDRKLNLKEGLLSHLGFLSKGLDSGVFKLQEEKLINDVSKAEKNLFVYPRKNLVVISLLLLISICLVGFIPESEVVTAKKKEIVLTKKITSTNAEALKKELEELEKSLTDEEKELLEKSKIIEAVKELDEKEDKEEAFSDLAKLEQELRKELKSESHQADLAMLKKLEEEALKDELTKSLGEDLKKKDFKEAAEELKKFELDEKQLKDLKEELKDKKELTKEEMKELKEKHLDKLAEKLKEMKALNKSAKKSLSKDGAKNKDGLAGDLGELSEALEEFEGDLADLNDLEKGEKLSKEELEKLKEALKKCEKCAGKCNSKMGKLGKNLKNMGVKQSYMDKLMAMKDKLDEAQMSLASGKVLVPSNGLEAGEGVDRSANGQKTEITDNGQFSQIKGEKGEGKSLVAVEAAESGTGRSKIQGKSNKKDFKTQTESFMNREDIPDDLKGGVKNYFNSIHNIEDKKKEKE